MADSIFHVLPDQHMVGRGNMKNQHYILVICWLLAVVVTYWLSTVGSTPCKELLKTQTLLHGACLKIGHREAGSEQDERLDVKWCVKGALALFPQPG